MLEWNHKRDYGHILDDIPPQMKILNSNTLLQFHLKLERCKPHNAACYLMKCDVINDVKLFPTVQFF